MPTVNSVDELRSVLGSTVSAALLAATLQDNGVAVTSSPSPGSTFTFLEGPQIVESLVPIDDGFGATFEFDLALFSDILQAYFDAEIIQTVFEFTSDELLAIAGGLGRAFGSFVSFLPESLAKIEMKAPKLTPIDGLPRLTVGVPIDIWIAGFSAPDQPAISLIVEQDLAIRVAFESETQQQVLKLRLATEPGSLVQINLAAIAGEFVGDAARQRISTALTNMAETVLRPIATVADRLDLDVLSQNLDLFVQIPDLPILNESNSQNQFNFGELIGVLIRCSARSETAGSIVVGVHWQTGSPPPPLERLSSTLDGQSNFTFTIHESLINNILTTDAMSAYLSRIAREEQSNVELQTVNVRIVDRTIRIELTGELIDACGFVNFPFKANQRFTFSTVDGRIQLTREPIGTSWRWNSLLATVQQVGCILDALSVIRPLSVIFTGVQNPLLVGVWSWATTLFDAKAVGTSQLLAFSTSLPRTSKAVAGPCTALHDIDGRLNIAAQMAVIENPNTVAFIQVGIMTSFGGDSPFAAKQWDPWVGAQVELFDKDIQPILGDDIDIPPDEPEETVTFGGIGNRSIRTTEARFVAPKLDTFLGKSVTNFKGVATIEIPHGFRAAGRFQRTETSERQGETQTTLVTEDTPISERAPDLYVRVQLRSGQVLNSTQRWRNGLRVNVPVLGNRIGTRAAPFVLALPQEPQVHETLGVGVPPPQ
jgi:hypothetical protein